MDVIKNQRSRLDLGELKNIFGRSLRSLTSNKLGGVALWLVIFNYLQTALGFLINIWLANRLGPANYGVLSYALVTGAFISLLVAFAADKTLVRDLVQSEDAAAVLTASLVLRLTIAVLVAIGCWIWFSFDHDIGSKFWPIILCLVAATLFSLTPAAWFDARYKMHLHAGITLGEKSLYGTSLLSASLLFPLSAVMAAGALLFSSCTSCLVQWKYTFRSFSPRFKGLMNRLRWLLRENYLIFLAALSNLCLTHANQLVLARKTDLSNLAFYAVAFQISSFVVIFQNQFTRLLDPKISRLTMPGAAGAEKQRSLILFCLLAFAASAVMVLPILFLAPWVIKVFFRPEYLGAVPPLRVLCIWLVLFGPAQVNSRFLLGLRLDRQYFLLTFSAGLLALALGPFMIDHWGATGVALTLLIAHSFSISGQFYLVYKHINRVS